MRLSWIKQIINNSQEPWQKNYCELVKPRQLPICMIQNKNSNQLICMLFIAIIQRAKRDKTKNKICLHSLINYQRKCECFKYFSTMWLIKNNNVL